ncbi:MAG: NADH-quinone oxidoreductase subunit M [Acidobacteriia bacterium]|nr:NADH-quinone oxidoreductase subunit M [Terriglobia bacterium]
MEFFNSYILTLLILTPVVGALVLALLNKEKAETLRRTAFGFGLLTFVFSLHLVARFSSGQSGFQFAENHAWIPAYGIRYHVGVDGISLWLVILATFLTVVSILASWKGIEKRVKEFFIFILLLEAGMIGVFLSLDLFLFYVFWEVMLVPMYFLIGIWGHGRRIYAAVKFIIYTAVGSALMLVAILSLYFLNARATGVYTFDFPIWLNNIASNRLWIDPHIQNWLFLAFFASFAIKVPIFPLHTWLPDAHTEAPTAGSVLLAGVLLKMGTYGLLRFNVQLFPEATRTFTPFIITLAIIGIIYGALVAMVQPDLKRMVAYSSVSHLGFVVLGIFVFNMQGVEGAIYQMLNHGISTGGLFLIVGMIYERRHTREIAEFGGLATPMPRLATCFMIITLSSIGLPLLNGFVGEFLILVGGFGASIARAKLYTSLAATGVVWGAVYMLWMYQRVMLGEVTHEANKSLPDLSGREKWVLVPLILLALWMGIYPQFFLRKMDASVSRLLNPPIVMMVQK